MPSGVGWAVVESKDGRIFGFVKQSRINGEDLPPIFRAELAYRAGIAIRRAS